MDRGLALARSGVVDHEGWRLRRWRDVILADPRGAAPADPSPLAETNLVWRGEREIWVPAWDGWLEFHAPDEAARTDLLSAAGPVAGLAVDWLRTATLTIRSDRAGASLRLGPRQRRRKLKGLYQSLAIAPWQRARLPLVFHEGQLIYAAGLGLDSDCSNRHPGPVQIGWRSADPSP
jgi:tRNA(Ile)-lysidine synthase